MKLNTASVAVAAFALASAEAGSAADRPQQGQEQVSGRRAALSLSSVLACAGMTVKRG